MPIDYSAAENFIWSAARLVDRHRYSMLFADGPAERVVQALRGYRNPDGGFGHALEPDLRCAASQPAPTLYGLEILNEAGAADSVLARDARGWIAKVAEPDGGIPSVLPGFEQYPHASWFQPEPGSVLTLALAASVHAGGVTDDAWLDRATNWCWRSIETAEQPGGYWLKFACAFLDAVPDEQRARAAPLPPPKRPVTWPVQRGPDRGSPRRRRVRAAGRRRLDVRLARLVAGTDVGLARQRHDSRAHMAARQRTSLKTVSRAD